MKNLMLTLSLLLVVSCGYDQSQLEENAKNKKATDDTATDGAGMTEDTDSSETEVDVNVSVKVKMKKEASKERALIYRPKLVTWFEALAKAPKGFRLLHRYEFVQLYDSGQLSDFADAGCYVWTMTKVSDVEDWAWVFHLDQGIESMFPYTETFSTLYISDDKTTVKKNTKIEDDENTDSNSNEQESENDENGWEG